MKGRTVGKRVEHGCGVSVSATVTILKETPIILASPGNEYCLGS